jgi:DNA polymerase III subunit chi
MTTEIRFYHLERQSLEQVLPGLLLKALESGHRILIRTVSDALAEKLNDHLWASEPDSFIPHGTHKDGHATRQPVFLSADDQNPNNADMLILTHGAMAEDITSFKLCCTMLDGRNPEAVKTARTLWAQYKDAGHAVTYWQQGDTGWQKKS